MQVEYTGRQVTITRSLRALAEEGIERINKILGRTTKAHVVLTVEKHRKCAEVTVQTKNQSVVGESESTSMETALREALSKAEKQAVRYKKKFLELKRQPKEEKIAAESQLLRTRRSGRPAPLTVDESELAAVSKPANGKGRGKPMLPVTVHSFPAKVPIAEPHVVKSSNSVALRPMTLEEAVKEAEFRDRDVFVFRNHQGMLMVLHRKRDGKMELIEAP
jgi:putative sigma-54 modulation protein